MAPHLDVDSTLVLQVRDC